MQVIVLDKVNQYEESNIGIGDSDRHCGGL
jgi:hypothetical protein